MSARARACVCMCLCVCVCVCVCVCTRAGGRRGRAPIRRYSSIRSLSFQPPETPPAHHARSMGLRSHLEAKARHAGPVALNGGFAVGDGIGGLGEEHALVAGRLFVLAHAAGLFWAGERHLCVSFPVLEKGKGEVVTPILTQLRGIPKRLAFFLPSCIIQRSTNQPRSSSATNLYCSDFSSPRNDVVVYSTRNPLRR